MLQALKLCVFTLSYHLPYFSCKKVFNNVLHLDIPICQMLLDDLLKYSDIFTQNIHKMSAERIYSWCFKHECDFTFFYEILQIILKFSINYFRYAMMNWQCIGLQLWRIDFAKYLLIFFLLTKKLRSCIPQTHFGLTNLGQKCIVP